MAFFADAINTRSELGNVGATLFPEIYKIIVDDFIMKVDKSVYAAPITANFGGAVIQGEILKNLEAFMRAVAQEVIPYLENLVNLVTGNSLNLE